MTVYLSELNQVQIGKEVTYGTAVTTTAKVMGIKTFDITPITDATIQHDLRGSLATGYNVNLLRQGATAAFTQDLSYDELYFIESLLGYASPVGAGPYTRAYAAPLTSTISALRQSTIQYGQSGMVYQLTSAFVDKLSLSGTDSDPLQCSGSLFAQKAATGTLAALTDRTVTMCMGSQASIYVDTWAGTMGTTVLPTTSWAWKLDLDSKRQVRRYVGNLAPQDWNEGGDWTGKLTLSAEVNATSTAWITTLLGMTGPLQLQVQIKYTSDTNHILTIGFAGSAIAAPKLFNNRQGIAAFDLVLEQTYNSTFANWLKVNSTNQVSTLP